MLIRIVVTYIYIYIQTRVARAKGHYGATLSLLLNFVGESGSFLVMRERLLSDGAFFSKVGDRSDKLV